MGYLAINNNIIDKYLSFLFKLDDSSKKRLIVKLSESIEEENKEKTDIKKLFGAWIDERTSDEIIDDIRSSRHEKSDTIGF